MKPPVDSWNTFYFTINPVWQGDKVTALDIVAFNDKFLIIVTGPGTAVAINGAAGQAD